MRREEVKEELRSLAWPEGMYREALRTILELERDLAIAKADPYGLDNALDELERMKDESN